MGLCGSSVAPPNPDEVDLTHFELLKVVGKGGFGKVNAVQKHDDKQLYALKRIEKFAALKSKGSLEMIWIERKIMSMTTSPFLCNIVYAFQSPTELYIVMPFMQGGDLRYHLKERGVMDEKMCQFYAAQIVLGLSHLHSHNIVYRDLKPENMLLDADGNLRLSDFGLASILTKENNYQIIGMAGTKGYLAPEILLDWYYGTEVDIFSLGVTLYELLHQTRPFKDIPHHRRRSITANMQTERENELRNFFACLNISDHLKPETKSLLKGMLEFDRSKRLGSGPKGWEDVKNHPFFNGIDWEKMERREYDPPIKPNLNQANCTADADLMDQLVDDEPRKVAPELQEKFKGWSYNTTIKKPHRASIIGGVTVDVNKAGINPNARASIVANGSLLPLDNKKSIQTQEETKTNDDTQATTTTTTTEIKTDNIEVAVEEKQQS